MNICEVRNLAKEYPSFRLDNVSFSLREGEITGFIGRNGAGKTTTIKSMLNLIHPASGEILYFGKSFAENEAEIKKRIGYSTGAINYYPKKKLGRIIEITKSFYDNWDESAYRKYLTLFQLDENKSPFELSEGMKVKINLLCALSHRAEILILDEPTSGLDPFSRDELLDIFTDLANDGVSILSSTHITSDLEKCADNIVYIRRGQVVCDLPKAEFSEKLGNSAETLEETVLRLEKEARI